MISLSLIWYNNYQFYYHFYVATESKTPNLLTRSTYLLLTTFLPSLSGSIVTPTTTVSLGKWALSIKQYLIWYTSLFNVYAFYTGSGSGSGSHSGLESDLGFGKWLLYNSHILFNMILNIIFM